MYVWQNIHTFPHKGGILSLYTPLRSLSRHIFNSVSLTRQETEMEKAKEEVKTWNLDLG